MARLFILLVLLVSIARAESQLDPVQIKILTDPPGAEVILERRGALDPNDRTSVGTSGTRPLILRVPREQKTVTLHLEHWLCEPRIVTLELDPYRANLKDTYGPEKLQYRSWAHALLDKLQSWVTALLALVLVAVGLYVRQWRQADRMRRQAALDSARAGEILNLIVPAAGDPMVGARLDVYRLTEKLGQGGMARVYKGQPEGGSEHEAVAIKILDAELATEEQFVRRFNREKDVYADLNHPNIVRVLGFGTFQEHYYLVMELIRGTTLRKHITGQGIPPDKVLRYLRPVFQAVAYAHSRGIVHRDLKPENIMVTDGGRIKVMDFGMAAGQAYSAVTVTGSLLGTPVYMAPEQAQGQLDPRSDQYALGIMVYEMLTGKPPFLDDNPVNIVLKHLGEEPPSLAEIRPEFEGVAPVVQRMLAKSPDDRYPDVEQALAALEQVLR
jgi:tRNA A-37 threonylcarbamoyl transferase component Bud32